MQKFFIFFLSFLIPSCFAENGIITFYSNTNNACQFDDSLYSDFLKVAISGSNWDNSRACGTCLTINGNGSGIGTTPFVNFYNAIVVNLCSECENHHYDLLLDGNGIWDMSYNIIPCDNLGEIQYRINSNNPYYFRLQVINTKTPVINLNVNGQPCEKTFDNFWVLNQVLTYPVTVHFELRDGTSFNGQVYENFDFVPFVHQNSNLRVR